MALSSDNLPEAIHALRDVLAREKASGTERLELSADSVQRLRGLAGRIQQQQQQQPIRPQIQPAAAPTPVVTEPSREAPTLPAEEKPAPTREAAPTPAPTQPAPASSSQPGALNPPGATKAEKIAWLANQAEHCEACRGLGTLRDVMVFSVGNPSAELMFVGEAPGFEEERQREPFVGPAGQKLTAIIKAMGLRRPEDVYISNIVKFRPAAGDPRLQGQRNRKPTPVEMGAAVKYVLAEIEVVKPKAIVALGATAAEGLLGISGSIARLRNQFHDLHGIPVMVTYHPSYLLRQESNSQDKGKADKRKVWEDMLMVMERIGLPISDKQRGYFS